MLGYSVGFESIKVVSTVVVLPMTSESINVENVFAFSVVTTPTEVDNGVVVRKCSVMCIPSHIFGGNEIITAVSAIPLTGLVAATTNE